MQIALLKASDRWRRVSVMDHPDAYVRKIVVRRFLSDRRRRASKEVVTSSPPETVAGGFEEAVGTRDELRRALVSLAPRQRAVLVLRYYADLDDAAIAGVLGCGKSTVRSQASRALVTVRTHLELVRAEES